MKLFVVAILISLSFLSGGSVYAVTNPELEDIKQHMEDPAFGKTIDPNSLKGFYIGACYDSVRTSTESLFINTFINAEGHPKNLGISSLQAYDGFEIPAHLAFLLQPGEKSLSFIENLVKEGFSGTDNNLGKIGPGRSFKYLYSSMINNNTFTVFVKPYRNCDADNFCNPPVLQACENGYDAGRRIYQGCFRKDDMTVFKKEGDSTLISHRTAQGLGERMNNLSFYLEPISTYCRWVKRPHVTTVKPQSCRTCGPQGYPGCQVCD